MHTLAVFAATELPPDSAWIPVVALIFAVPIGAFMALYAIITCWLFHSQQELLSVTILQVGAILINGLAVLVLLDSDYTAFRYLIVPTVALTVSLCAGAITFSQAVRMSQAANRV